MTLLEKNCSMIITDSGGVQKESHFFRKPCIVLRKETEWIELVANGTVRLVDASPELIRNAFAGFMQSGQNLEYPGFYGDGKTAEFILNEILLLFAKDNLFISGKLSIPVYRILLYIFSYESKT